MLLYPTVKEDFSLRWSLQDHEIFVASLN